MNLPRVKELLAAWETGALREGEAAELRKLLGEVVEAAEVPDHASAMKEAERILEQFVDRDSELWKHGGTGIALVMIAMGIRREGRGRSN